LITSTIAASAQGKLRDALESSASQLPSIISYEQLSVLPGTAASLTQSVLQDNFHHVTLTGVSLVAGQPYAGTINLNTASPVVWRSILETYNSAPGVTPLTADELYSFGNAIAQSFASSLSGKDAAGPFTDAAGFGASTLLSANLPSPITPEEFMAAIGSLLMVRSDTFRVRGYGEAFNPGDGSTVEAIAHCEAIVQRTPELAPSGLGRKFTITYFRWLGSDDI